MEAHKHINTSRYQNGKHLLGPIAGSEYNESYDLEEEAMLKDSLTEMGEKSSAPSNFKMGRENITGEDEYMTPLQGIGMGATTSPTQSELVQGFSAGGGGGAVTKKIAIDDEEEMAEEEKRLEMEVRQYEMLLKRTQLEAMQIELEKLSPKKTT